MNAQMLRRQPQSGDLFALDLGQRGLLKPRFAGISQKNALASEG